MAAQHKLVQLDQIKFENVSFQVAGLDPVLKSVDLDIPMDQTVIVQSTDPAHAVHFLELLAGRKQPQKGQVHWCDAHGSEDEINSAPFHEVVSGYFESSRPHPDMPVSLIFANSGATGEVIQHAVEHFGLKTILSKKFQTLTYEHQKICMLITATLRTPQMLVLEDPAVGLKESQFLNFLDWVQYWQRQGQLRHIFMTNHHPTAARHFDHLTMLIDEGLVYVEDETTIKKAYHF